MTAGTVVITGGILATVILLCIIAVLCYCRLQVRLGRSLFTHSDVFILFISRFMAPHKIYETKSTWKTDFVCYNGMRKLERLNSAHDIQTRSHLHFSIYADFTLEPKFKEV